LEASRALDLLQEKGYRLTPQRRAVVRALGALNSPTFPELLELCPQVGMVTVYRTLGLLRNLSLVQRLYPQGEARYTLRPPCGYAGRFVCERCGQVRELTKPDAGAAQALVSGPGAFVRTNWVEIYGYCAECASGNLGPVRHRNAPAYL